MNMPQPKDSRAKDREARVLSLLFMHWMTVDP
jgi:hypothetical protein